MNLRVTVHVESGTITLKLEGSLAGPRVRVLEESWASVLATPSKPRLCVDLTDVTFVDDDGQACLAAMYHQGATLVAADALTKDIVAEITQGELLDNASGKRESERRASRDRGYSPRQ